MLKVFATRLQHGQCWDVIRGIDDATLRKHCRDWLTAANEPTLRDHLVAELIQLGISEPIDIDAVLQQLRSSSRGNTLAALRLCASVPRELLPTIEAICDETPDSEYWHDDWYAREILIRANR